MLLAHRSLMRPQQPDDQGSGRFGVVVPALARMAQQCDVERQPEAVLRAPARVGDTLGYARVSTHDQNPDAQSDRLIEAGAIRVFTDIVSGKRFDRPGLAELINHARPGDRLCIIRLDRLGRSLRELLETVDGLKARGIQALST